NKASPEIPEGNFGLGHNLLSIVGSEVAQPLEKENLVLVCNGEIYNYSQIRNQLEKNSGYDFKTDSDSEAILALIFNHYNGSLLHTIPQVVKQLDGDYAFAVHDGENMAAARDPIGVKPLYYGGNKGLFAFASERKALWDVGIDETHSLPPGFMLHNHKLVPLPPRLSWKLNQTIETSKSETTTLNPDKEYFKMILKDFILESVQKRIRGLDKVGILFSGGVDSTLLAVICKNLGIQTDLYAVGSENSPDLSFARKVADDMDLPLYIQMVDESVVREFTPRVLNAIEEWNVMKLGVGMTAYLAAKMAHENGERVMLSGQGADELFGGYHRYLNFYQQKGEKAQEDLKGDVENLYQVNLERDDKVCMANSVELRVPYLDLQIINMAMKIPIKEKISGPEDRMRKCILREVASQMGVPPEIVKRPKKAAQYGSGIHKILKKRVLKDPEYMQQLRKSFKFIDI
ncbi:MAG: asparagine synthetase B, partial [Methanobacterium sp.]|nr:asparagine synthetase B [Methanobacterium sp.]